MCLIPGAEQYIIDSRRWCGIIPDEGVDENGKVVETPPEKHPHAPYRQSQRKDIYRRYAEPLVENSDADTLEEYIRAEGMPIGKVMNCIRLALSGSSSGLGIHDIMSLIGKGETLSRVHYIKERLG